MMAETNQLHANTILSLNGNNEPRIAKNVKSPLTFLQIIQKLQKFWEDRGCNILPSYDMEVAAGTLSPYTALMLLEHKKWKAAYVQKSRRPQDGRVSQNKIASTNIDLSQTIKNRLSSFYQFQVIIQPMNDLGESNAQQLCIDSLKKLGLSQLDNDMQWISDNWSNESIGAYGNGYELRCNGTEIIQLTYMHKMGGEKIEALELTYGLERIAMCIQNKTDIFSIVWGTHKDGSVLYQDINSREDENSNAKYFHEYTGDKERIYKLFTLYKEQAADLIDKGFPLQAYEYCIKASHAWNVVLAKSVATDLENRQQTMEIASLVRKVATSLSRDNM